MTNLQLAGMVAFYAVIGTMGLALMKRGLPTDVSFNPLTAASLRTFILRRPNVSFVVGFVCYATSFATSMVLLTVRPLNVIFPIITAAAYLGAIAMGYLFLGELLTIAGAFGIVLIALGIAIVAGSS